MKSLLVSNMNALEAIGIYWETKKRNTDEN